jgi:uncharacterized LabA/DUF88 family protein
MPDRVAVLIDEANAYRAFKAAFGSARYSPARLARQLAAGRQLARAVFYTAVVPRQMGESLYAGQRRFLSHLRNEPDLSVWTGHMARSGDVWYEKGVDVKIATDLVAWAYQSWYDIAILVSGDGDLAPAVHEVRRLGRTVETAMPRVRRSRHLLQESSRFIEIDRPLFDRCRL